MISWTKEELAKRLAENQALRLNPKYSIPPKENGERIVKKLCGRYARIEKEIKEQMPVPTEEEEQEALAELLDHIGVRYCHVPNGGQRHIVVAQKLQKAGVKAGVPDILIFTPPPSIPGRIGTAIELKRRRGGTVSDFQQEWLKELNRLGWYAVVCRGVEEAEKTLRYCGYL